MATLQLFALLLLATASSAAKLPKHWKTCKINDPNISECVKNSVKEIHNEVITEGIPSFGILPMDPLHIVRLELDQANSGSSVALKLTFKDLNITGFRHGTLQDFTVDWEKGMLQGTFINNNKVELLGNYEVNGKILLLPLAGEGKCNFTIVEPFMNMTQKGSFTERKGKKYFHVDKTWLELKPKRVYSSLDNLFNGDKTLGDNMNKVLNENWEEVFYAFQPTIAQGFAESFRAIANRLFDKVPFDEIAPPS